MYKMNGDVYMGTDDTCYYCDKYKNKTCMYCMHLKNITGELNARLIILDCEKFVGPGINIEEEISF